MNPQSKPNYCSLLISSDRNLQIHENGKDKGNSRDLNFAGWDLGFFVFSEFANKSPYPEILISRNFTALS